MSKVALQCLEVLSFFFSFAISKWLLLFLSYQGAARTKIVMLCNLLFFSSGKCTKLLVYKNARNKCGGNKNHFKGDLLATYNAYLGSFLGQEIKVLIKYGPVLMSHIH